MRYVAVFTLFDIPVARGFTSEGEAVRCLEKASNDPDLSPIGIYDAASGAVTFEEQEEYSSADMNEELIIRLAQSYIDRIV